MTPKLIWISSYSTVDFLATWEEIHNPDFKLLEFQEFIEDDKVCGFARCIGSVVIYIDDLLVDKAYRGREFGRCLMERVCKDFPNKEIYVLSDVDAYYSKLGYEKAGTVFQIKPFK